MARLQLQQRFGFFERGLCIVDTLGLVDVADQERDFVDSGAGILEQPCEPGIPLLLRNSLDDLDYLFIVMAGQTLAGQFLERREVAFRQHLLLERFQRPGCGGVCPQDVRRRWAGR